MKKSFALVAALAMFISLTNLPLAAAKERCGSTVVVTMSDGHIVKGELLAVKSDVLLVYDQDAGQGKSIDLKQVAQVKVLKKSKFLQGLAIGLGVGLGIANYTIKTEDKAGLFYGLSSALLVPITGLICGYFGAIGSKDKKFSLAGESSQVVQENLKLLKRYACEQNVEKLAAPFRHRFRLLWSPGPQFYSGNSDFRAGNGTFRFVSNAPLKDTALYPFEPRLNDILVHLRTGQLRLEYELTPHLSPSLEFIASGKLFGTAYFGLSYYSTDYARQYDSNVYLSNGYSYTSLLLGLNWKPFSSSIARKNIIEFGIAAGPAQT